MLKQHVKTRPDARYLTFNTERITFADLDAWSDRVATALAFCGGPGKRVAILAQASPLFFELLFGCAKAGVILVPINWRLSAREIENVLVDAEPSLVFVSEEFAPLLPSNPSWHTIRTVDFAVWRDAAPVGQTYVETDPDEPVLILYTSGTTGHPKGAMLSQRNLSYLGRTASELWGFTFESVNLVAMPLFHIGGIGYGLLGLSQGGETVLTQETNPGALIELMTRHAVSHAFFVPTVIQRLVDHIDASGTPAPRVDHIVYGAAPIGEALLRRAIAAFGSRFHHAYGMTETAGTVVTLDPEDHDPEGIHAARLRSCGRPMPWVELILVDPVTGREVGVGEVGEIRMRSPTITRGYWRKLAESAAAITEDGWLCSGDAAVRDADGYIYIRDRYKDMIVSGGENIYPMEIDNVLQHHPAVAEVAVVGVPHLKWGETPRAYVVLRQGFAPTEEEMIAFAREHLARYKCPTSVLFVGSLPRNASGKILKRELRGI
jgi:long-chain acyl-CoA synthetase